MTNETMSTRDRILAAAEDLSAEGGPLHLSLEAVAARAGVSKGGLLYNFPTKAKLLAALVERHLAGFEEDLEERSRRCPGTGPGVAEAFIDLFLDKRDEERPKDSALLAALAEDPSFLGPVRDFNRKLVDRLAASSEDPALAIIVFLALNGLRSMDLFRVDVLTDEELETVTARMRDLVAPVSHPPQA